MTVCSYVKIIPFLDMLESKAGYLGPPQPCRNGGFGGILSLAS